jgi:glycosyltransferase involved in cell wall biosynthesis
MPTDIERQYLAQSNIVMVTSTLQGGGAERVLSDMANYLASKKGWSVTLATWAGPEIVDFYSLDPDINRIWLDVGVSDRSAVGKVRANLARIAKLRSVLSELKPDAVLSFINASNVLTILAAKGLKMRVVVSERVQPDADSTLSFGWSLLRRIVYAWSDEIVAQSVDAAKWIEQNCRKSATVIPNPLRSLPRLTCERQPLIVAVGRLTGQKGFDLLIRAFVQIAADFEEWTIAIIGQGDERDNLIKLRDELRLTQRVQFVGEIRDVETWMARAGLVVQPSRFEGFPNVVLEAMGMGTAVISSDCRSGPSDMIEDGINGRLVPVEDVSALAKVMAELMSQRDVRESLGYEAFETAQRYRQELVMSQWESCLRGNA